MRKYFLDEIENHIYGRVTDERRPLTLFFTGSGVEFNLKANELDMEFYTDYDNNEQWISILINDFPVSRRMLQKGTESVCIFRGMSSALITNVKILKDVQPVCGDLHELLQVVSVSTDGSFFPIEEKKCNIEFIGDSIASGEGTIGNTNEMDWIPMWFSCLRNFTYLIANQMNADYRVISQSGWGVHCGWNNDIHSNIPSIYNKVCGLAIGEMNEELHASDPYDFTKWQPDYIIINLGTNDESAFRQGPYTDPETGKTYQMRLIGPCIHKDDNILFQNDVIQFIRNVRENNPNSYILWVYGMLGYLMEQSIQEAIEKYRTEDNDNNIEFLLLKDTKDGEYGARSHPGIISHKRAAEMIIDKLNS